MQKIDSLVHDNKQMRYDLQLMHKANLGLLMKIQGKPLSNPKHSEEMAM